MSRRSAYKGKVNGLRCGFPIDVCTLPGFCGCVAIMLSAKGLSRALLDSVWKCFDGLNQCVSFTGTFKLLAHEDACWIEITEGMMKKDSLKRVLEYLEISFSR